MPLFSRSKPKGASVYDLPQPIEPPAALTQRKVPPIPEGQADVNDPLSVAIFYHELNQLEVAAYYFSLSAAQGNPLGLFLFAISMRHGWGMPRNEEEAVRLLQVAANQATGEVAKQAAALRRLGKRYSFSNDRTGSVASGVAGVAQTSRTPGSNPHPYPHLPRQDSLPHHLQQVQSPVNDSVDSLTYPPASQLDESGAIISPTTGNARSTLSRASRQGSASTPPSLSELVLAIFELAMSFKQGWGLPKNKITAVYYLNMAAELGDPDAQIELAECYLRGDGIKPNKQKAAYWLRRAEKQGARLVQMQWIWKEKYNSPDDDLNP
ncbi:hypothetical protein HK105_204541 [Polyrhizophydium stewartii]|uniref:Uncharacterized protein n=1 Tax=Polyrhizophydium stewartii TaxID=2732419 RepID=A0ABR4N8L3_9FUNG|nr:hypothetical protein HK105_004470 [Polyrhizophydium stewartii]